MKVLLNHPSTRQTIGLSYAAATIELKEPYCISKSVWMLEDVTAKYQGQDRFYKR